MTQSKFRTTEISDPSFECSNLRFITVKTPNLNGRGDICVFVPPFNNLKDIPLVILLHGVYGSSWVWSQKAGVHLSALTMMQKQEIQPMVIAMPSDGLWGDGSAYLNHTGLDFEKWIADDVPSAVIENIPEISQKSKMFIGGLSMGGFGALHVGIKHNDQFKGISVHSSITDIQQMSLFVEEDLSCYNQRDSTDQSIWELIRKHRTNLPAIRFDCGTEDLLYEYNCRLHEQLKGAGINHVFEEYPGAHDWSYWQLHVRDSLSFFNKF